MKSILPFFIFLLTFSFYAQNNFDEKDLIGVWNLDSSAENEFIFNKEENLRFNSFGYQFQKDNILIVRTVDLKSQCASPLSYKNIETKWKIINNSIIEISNIESKKGPLHYIINKLENEILILDLISENKN